MTTIDVTQECIDSSTREDCRKCAIAKAINPMLRDGLFALVEHSWGRVTIYADDGRYRALARYELPKVARAFGRDDGSRVVERLPISFPLDIPPHLLREAPSC